MKEILLKGANKTIEFSFYLLFFLVPLVLTPFNYELFEYNKMMLTYAITIVIVGAWAVKTIASKQMRVARTPLDIPIILFLLSQIVSTIFSFDRHVSLFGYYSRFNGGLFSTASYILLYYAFVSNFPKEKIKKLFSIMLISGMLVSIYGILEHFGIDKDIWVQDVQNRVFSTLGQPNWLAAYLSVLLPISIGVGLNSFSNLNSVSETKVQSSKFKVQSDNSKFKNIGLLGYCLPRRYDTTTQGRRPWEWRVFYWGVIGTIFYITLIFTKSRSGFLGFWMSLIIFWLISLYSTLKTKSQPPKTLQILAAAKICMVYAKLIGIYILTFILITFFLGAPFPQINRFTFPELLRNHQPSAVNHQPPPKPLGSSIIDVGITESGVIRRIVWKGALDIFRHYPFIGSGVETFAFAYYKFRPIEHNMTSEWDFLYNKAHNEYLNYAATTGIFGLGSYLLFIGGFIIWCFKKMWEMGSGKLNSEMRSEKDRLIESKISHIPLPHPTSHFLLLTSLFSAWLSILITNFFGFSVVIIQLFFFLIPAITFVLSTPSGQAIYSSSTALPFPPPSRSPRGHLEGVLTAIILFSIFYFLFSISRLWYADTFFASGYHSSRTSDYSSSYQSIKKAISLNNHEPLYYDELSFPAAQLAIAFNEERESTYSSYLKEEAMLASKFAVTLSPNNVNFWKTRTRVFYALAQLDEKYLNDAFTALKQAKTLSPTDPKISYNLGLLYDKLGRKDEAISELIETTRLKPDYRDAYFALGLFYQRDKQKEKAKEAFNFIISRIATDDADAKKMLEELK